MTWIVHHQHPRLFIATTQVAARKPTLLSLSRITPEIWIPENLCHVVVTALLGMTSAAGAGGPMVPVLGASGAVFGLLAAYGLIFPERVLLIFFVLPMKAKHAVLLFAALELVATWNPNNGIANLAHLGGMVTGWLYLKQGWRLGGLTKIKPLQALKDPEPEVAPEQTDHSIEADAVDPEHQGPGDSEGHAPYEPDEAEPKSE